MMRFDTMHFFVYDFAIDVCLVVVCVNDIYFISLKIFSNIYFEIFKILISLHFDLVNDSISIAYDLFCVNAKIQVEINLKKKKKR